MLKFHVCNVTVKVLSDKYTATISEAFRAIIKEPQYDTFVTKLFNIILHPSVFHFMHHL